MASMTTDPARLRLRRAALSFTALVLFALGWADLAQHYTVAVGPALVLAAARAAPVLWVRSRPLLAWGFSLAACLLTAALTHPVSSAEPWPMSVTALATQFVLLLVGGALLGRAVSAAMAGTLVGAAAVLLVVLPGRGEWSGLVAVGVAAAVALAGAELLRDRAATRRRLAEQEQISEAERVRRTLLEERARIGRELHDVVAHHMSLIAVRAETAPYRLPDCPAPVREEFRAVGDAAREALTDMRRLLGLLRGGDDVERAPQPDASGIPALVAAAGPTVDLKIDGDPERIPAAAAVCAYRVVQESLTNARRHAPGAPVTVELRVVADAVLITVRNGPAAARPEDRTLGAADVGRAGAGGGGHGLMGMRERVGAVGGTCAAGEDPDGGFTVTAALPLTDRF
jgi:signal transduction histidine kinase